jgi:hypothetical protein
MRAQMDPADRAFGQMLASASSAPRERGFAQGKVRRNQADQGDDVCAPPEPEERNAGGQVGARSDKLDQDDSLAGAFAVTAQPAPVEHCPTAQTQTAAEESAPVDTTEATTAVEAAVEKELPASAADGAKIANGRMLAATTGTLTEMLTPTPEESVQIELPKGMSLTSGISPTTLPAGAEATRVHTTEALTGAAVQAAPSQSALQVELQALAADVSSADVPLTDAGLPTSTGTAASVPDDGRRPTRAARRAWFDALPISRGIAGAQTSQAMNTTIKKDESAGRAEQILPGALPSTVPPLPKLAGETSRTNPSEISGEVIAAAKLSTSPSLSPSPVRVDVADTLPAELRPLAPLGRISDILSREVRLFKRAADDLVEVVLTPDARTQISLRLQWRDGQVVAQARCDLGDYRSLNTQWPQLQAALADQGVRLSHLSERAPSGFTDFFNHPSFAQSQGGEEGSGQRAEDRGQRAAGSGQRGEDRQLTSDLRPRTSVNRRLLESWA